ncbi:conserved hypothetical protein [Neospora caninum Liverpool]|uniref:Ubiquitin-like domain-containing protein n=1 Tax=Neospora caninum (strain Liverpool) TaxID=572307 RepID=F0VGB5_NEOCL|nr:conserved hypothetical protein [Neospora caninum Liverpool]CBZ52759.1 conserved hypothetical protein [Neospora caninum Liverpool]CEL66741.1 TPA: hypothetical protein BN1204_025470 [Neospora caninum Liverpool]|eukprot:XP_003882791.1 conserved hypothetical protein [Neospora caninum Liverpool]
MRLCIVNPAGGVGAAEEQGQFVEARDDWTFSMLLRHLAEIGLLSFPDRGPSTAPKGLSDRLPPNVALTSDGVVFDVKKRLEDYAIQPETKLYISSATYSMPTRLFVILAETGDTYGFEVFSADRVQVLMRLIKTRLGVEEDGMILVHRGARLDPEKSLQDQCVCRDALVYLLLTSQAPPVPRSPPPPAPAGGVRGKNPGTPRGKDAKDAKKKPEAKKGKKSK